MACSCRTKLTTQNHLSALRRLRRVFSSWAGDGRVQIDYRWAEGDVDKARQHAIELVALAPDVIFALGNYTVAPLLQVTHTVPIVFAIVPDPVGAGSVESLSRPGGNALASFLSNIDRI